MSDTTDKTDLDPRGSRLYLLRAKEHTDLDKLIFALEPNRTTITALLRPDLPPGSTAINAAVYLHSNRIPIGAMRAACKKAGGWIMFDTVATPETYTGQSDEADRIEYEWDLKCIAMADDLQMLFPFEPDHQAPPDDPPNQ
jgi:hypothetical protein